MAKNKQNKNIILILILLALVVYYVYMQMKNKTKQSVPFSACCLSSNEYYNGTCETDPNCTCDVTKCKAGYGGEWIDQDWDLEIDSGDNGNDWPDTSDPLDADVELGSYDVNLQTSACCEGVAYNYDPNCLSDPNCNCDMSLCTSTPPATSHTCYSNCSGTNYLSLVTTVPCGTNGATDFPNTQAPYCAYNPN